MMELCLIFDKNVPLLWFMAILCATFYYTGQTYKVCPNLTKLGTVVKYTIIRYVMKNSAQIYDPIKNWNHLKNWPERSKF